MATYLQGSGAISMSQINSVFARGNSVSNYSGTTYYTSTAGPFTFSAGALGFNAFYGAGPAANTFFFTIASNQTNANLRTLAVNSGWNQSNPVSATINGGVYISSNGTGTPALTVNGSFPNGVALINNGIIIGMGGGGGRGKDGANVFGGPGAAGGLALSVASAISITNNGTIGGGGGGGGGGQGGGATDQQTDWYMGGGGGGGGRATFAANSAGGGGGNGPPAGGTGAVGTVNGGGSGALGGTTQQTFAGAGGAGATWGSTGATGGVGGSTGSYQYTSNGGPFAGGGGGGAVSGNGNVTWLATGTRLGSIS